MLRINLLGSVEARTQAGELGLGSRKQRTLLARLALATGRPVAVDRLVDDLWESGPPADPAHALQAHASRLRAVLPVEVEFAHGGYRLPSEAVEVDATRFATLVERGRAHLTDGSAHQAAEHLREALALWRGPAFGDLAGVPALRSHAVRLEEQRRGARADRIDADLLRGEHSAVIGELQSLLTEDPLQERAWRQLIVALYREDRQGEALAAYRWARETFIERLGVEPGDQLAELHQAVLQRTLPGVEQAGVEQAGVEQPGAGSAPPGDLPPEIARRVRTPLAGRERELAVLDRAWQRREHGPHLVTVTGEPGIGKTRLAAEMAARCARAGAQVLSGRCDESLTVPYQPFMEILRADLARHPPTDAPDGRLGPSPAELARLLPDLADQLPPGSAPPLRSDPDTERYRTHDAVAGWLAAASRESPLLLVLDDLQWADEPTVLLLHHLTRTSHPVRAVILVTYRAHEQAASVSVSASAPAPLADLLRQSEAVTHLPLTGLPREDVAALLSAELESSGANARVAGGLTTWVEDAAGGNPLFVVELAREMADSGGGPPQPDNPPTGVRQAVYRRLSHLPERMRDLLGCAAVVGRRFDPRVVQALAGLDDASLDELLRGAVQARLVERCPEPLLRYMFSHDLVRATLYDAIGTLRRATMHRQVAETVEQWHAADLGTHYAELAHHFSAAAAVGSPSEAVTYLTLAGQSAARQGAPAVAVGYLRRARDLLPVDADAAQRCDLLTALGTVECQTGDGDYRDTLLAAARLARANEDGARLAAAAVANSRGWWSSTAEVDRERVAMLEAALDGLDRAGGRGAAGDDPAMRAQLLCGWALQTVRDPDLRLESVRRSAEALELARASGDGYLLGQTLSDHYAVTHASFTDPRGCAAISAELVDLAEERADPGLQMMASVGHAQASALVGDLATSEHFLRRAEEYAVELNHQPRLWMVRTWEAMRLCVRGRLEEAEAAAGAAYEIGAASAQPDSLTWFAGQLFTLRWQQGRLGELIGEIEEQVASQSHGIPAWEAAYALALTQAGRSEEAQRILDDFADDALRRLPRDMLWLHGTAYLCEVAAALRRPEAAEVLYRELVPYAGLWAHNGTLEAGPVDYHLGVMARLTDEHDSAARHLAAAEATCRRVDAPWWLERSRDALGRCRASADPASA